MAVIVDYVKVRHSAVTLLLARLVFKFLQGYTLCESVNTQDFGWLVKEKPEWKWELKTTTNFSMPRKPANQTDKSVILIIYNLATDTLNRIPKPDVFSVK